MPPVQRLLDACLNILKLHSAAINDVGDVPYSLLRDVLFLIPAHRLRGLEEKSPHLIGQTEEIWQYLCSNDFMREKSQGEYGTSTEDPESWRDFYAQELLRQEAKMQNLRAKLKGIYQNHADGRVAIKRFDNIRELKRRRPNTTANARPKSLMQKVRSESQQIQSIYSPRKRISTAAASLSRDPPPPPLPPPPRSMSSSSFGNRSPRRKVPIVPVKTRLKTVFLSQERHFSSSSGKISAARPMSSDSAKSPFCQKVIEKETPRIIKRVTDDASDGQRTQETLHSSKRARNEPTTSVARRITSTNLFLPNLKKVKTNVS